jgi:D-alanyl-D-alanine dipeptidase
MPLRRVLPTDHLLLDIKYATADNFTGKPVYKKPLCFIHADAYEPLMEAVRLAAAQGLKVKVFDAFRPQDAQEIFWAHTPDPDFLAPPEKGSNHSRGVAVDLTLCDARGNELDMGTAFDAFTPLSFHAAEEVSDLAKQNRKTLLTIMQQAGWVMNPKEWWHYQLPNASRYTVLRDKELPEGMM